MKKRFLFSLITLLSMAWQSGYSYSFSASYDGETIYYNLINNNTAVEVTYRTTSYNSYSGVVDIPSMVTYNGQELPVTSIGDNAFYKCTGLTSVTIGESVTSIGRNAFYYCSGLTNVTIPSSVTSIGNYAFSGCSGLTSVTIPSSVTSIGYGAFSSCTGLTSVTIPSSVTSIGDNAFSSCTGLTSVTIPESVTSIGYGAFSRCTGLTSVTIPSSVTSIGDAAFSRCTGLTSVTIPSSVTSIGDAAFAYCSGLTNVTIPESVTSIGEGAFSSLTSVTINSNAIMSKTYTSSSSLKIIFGSVKSLIVGDGVSSIGNYAFYNCTVLTSVTIPESVTSIGNYSFSGCSGLTSVKVPVTDFATFCNNQIIPQIKNLINKPVILADVENNEITEYIIPNGVETIGADAFYNCSGLTSVTIPSSVTSIGDDAFSRCTGLTSVTIPSSVTSIGDDAFSGCSGLTSVTIGEGVTNIGSSAFSGCTGLSSVTIPEGVTNIGSSAFSGCSGLSSVTIPEGVTNIGSGVFTGCSELSVTINNDAIMSKTYTSSSSLKNILGSVKSLIVGDGVTSIGNYAFYGCTGLTSVSIPESVMNIGKFAFYNCTDLTKVMIGEGVTSIGDYAFRYCSGLTNVTIPESVTSIGSSAFSDCTGLSNVTIPSSVTSIGNEAFKNCANLTVKVRVNDFVTFCENKFVGFLDEKITKPVILIDMNGNDIADVVIPDGVTAIGNKAFANCVMNSITFPTSFTAIYSDAFKNVSVDNIYFVVDDMPKFCTNKMTYLVGMIMEKPIHLITPTSDEITEFVIPDGVPFIRENAFYKCAFLTSVTIPSSVMTIGNNAFVGCVGLEKVIVEDLDSWRMIAFGNQNANPLTFARHLYKDPLVEITNLRLYKDVTKIKNYAFSGYTGNVYCFSATPFSISQGVFSERSNMTLYVPYNSRNNYLAANYWKDFGQILEFDSEAETPYPDMLVAENSTQRIGELFEMPVGLENEDEIAAVEFQLELPEGMYVKKNKRKLLLITKSDRAENHELSASEQDDGTYKVLLYSYNNNTIADHSGDLFFISIESEEDMEVGDYSITLKNIVLTTPDESLIYPDDYAITVHLQDYNLGDVNDDGDVNVGDITAVVNHILGNYNGTFIFNAANVIEDNIINVGDVVGIAHIILYGMNSVHSPARMAMAANMEPNNHLSLDVDDDGKISLYLENSMEYTAFQFDVCLKGGATLADILKSEDRMGDLQLRFAPLDETGKYRVVAFSPMNEVIESGQGNILDLLIDGHGSCSLSVENIVFYTPTMNMVRFDNMEVLPTGLIPVIAGLNIQTIPGGIKIHSEREMDVAIMTNDGKLFRNLKVKTGDNVYQGIPSGVYVVGQKKLLINK